MAGIVFLIYARNFDGPFSSLSRNNQQSHIINILLASFAQSVRQVINTSPSKPLIYSVKDSEFKQSMASHATSFDGEPSRLKLIIYISVLSGL